MQYNQDSKFWYFATLVADFILLNLLFIVLCIPVVTIGPAIAALIHTTLKLSEDENRTLIKPFWNEFKRDITKKMLLWIVYLVLIAALAYMAQFYWDFANDFESFKIIGFMLFVLSFIILILTVIASIIGLAMTTKYFSTIKRLVKNSYLLILVMPIQSLIMAAVLVAATLFFIYQTVPVLSFFLVIGFSAVAYSFAPLIREIFTKVK